MVGDYRFGLSTVVFLFKKMCNLIVNCLGGGEGSLFLLRPTQQFGRLYFVGVQVDFSGGGDKKSGRSPRRGGQTMKRYYECLERGEC